MMMYGAGSVFICMYIHIYIHISGQQTWAVRRIHRENAFSIRDLVQEVCDYIYIYIYILYIYMSGRKLWAVRRIPREETILIRDLVQEVN